MQRNKLKRKGKATVAASTESDIGTARALTKQATSKTRADGSTGWAVGPRTLDQALLLYASLIG
jgi:hypothetical protein